MTTTRNEIIEEIRLRLGHQMVLVELDMEHYHLAITKSLEKFRQRSENSTEEDFYLFEIHRDIADYTLPEDIVHVQDLYGRVTGATAGGTDFEPFQAQYLNTFLLQSGRAGGIAVYDALAQHHETLGRVFGAEYLFTWNRTKHLLKLHRRPKSERPLIAHVYRERSEEDLFSDVFALPWLKDYALAMSKLMLGEARGKFATIPGPQGGTTLNGDQLKADAVQEMQLLEEDLKRFVDGSASWGVIIG